jgi:hypothetical protein
LLLYFTGRFEELEPNLKFSRLCATPSQIGHRLRIRGENTIQVGLHESCRIKQFDCLNLSEKLNDV